MMIYVNLIIVHIFLKSVYISPHIFEVYFLLSSNQILHCSDFFCFRIFCPSETVYFSKILFCALS